MSKGKRILIAALLFLLIAAGLVLPSAVSFLYDRGLEQSYKRQEVDAIQINTSASLSTAERIEVFCNAPSYDITEGNIQLLQHSADEAAAAASDSLDVFYKSFLEMGFEAERIRAYEHSVPEAAIYIDDRNAPIEIWHEVLFCESNYEVSIDLDLDTGLIYRFSLAFPEEVWEAHSYEDLDSLYRFADVYGHYTGLSLATVMEEDRSESGAVLLYCTYMDEKNVPINYCFSFYPDQLLFSPRAYEDLYGDSLPTFPDSDATEGTPRS